MDQSKEGIDVARERVRDVLAWEQVRTMLKSREDVDTARLAQLEINLKAARGEMASYIVMAYCIVVTVNDANDIDAFRLGLMERTADSVSWPCDAGGAAAVKIVPVKRAADARARPLDAKAATADLDTNEVQDLAEYVGEIRQAAAGYPLKFKVTVEVGESSPLPQGLIDDVNRCLNKVRTGWRLE